MRDFRVSLGQISPKLGDLGANLERHLDVIRQARKQKADVVVFPELSLTGYLLRDQVPEVAQLLGQGALQRLAAASRSIDVVAGFVEETPGHRYHNAAGYFSRGKLVHVHRKIYLPSYGMFHEARDFAAGVHVRRFDTRFGPCAMLVCEDLWHPTCAFLLAQQGAQVIFVLSNGPTRGTKPGRKIASAGVWERLLQVTAQFQTVYLVYVNRTGCEDGISFGGASLVVDPLGRTIARLPLLDEELATAELKSEVLRRARTAYPLLRDEDLELVHRELGRVRRFRFDLPDEPADCAVEPEEPAKPRRDGRKASR